MKFATYDAAVADRTNITGFYAPEVHGPRTIMVDDPDWVRPTIDIILQPGESYTVDDQTTTNDTQEPITLEGVPDVNAVPEQIEVDNPDTKIPAAAIEITDAQWQDSIDNPGRYWVNPTTLAFEEAPALPAAEVLASTAETQRTAMRAACAAAIVAGITSDALGSDHTYPTAEQDQANLAGTVLAAQVHGETSAPYKFWCADVAGNWARRDHTAAQIQAVGDAVRAHVVSCQDRYETRLGEIAAIIADGVMTDAEKQTALDAVVW